MTDSELFMWANKHLPYQVFLAVSTLIDRAQKAEAMLGDMRNEKESNKEKNS